MQPRAAFALAAAILALAPGSAAASFQVADWTAFDGAAAHGTFGGAAVSLTGSDVNGPPASVLDGSDTGFNRGDHFTPPLDRSDAIHFLGSSGGVYELSFGAAVEDPVLHLRSLASTLDFPDGTVVTRLSGDGEFVVSGSDVVGGLDQAGEDANGTVRIEGTFTSLPFRATFQGTDGIFLQVGVEVPDPPAPPPPPPAPETTINSPKLPAAVIWVTQPQFGFVASIDGSRFECRVDGQAWAACATPHRTARLASGPHVFEVRAISPQGVADETPAARRFEVGYESLKRLECGVRPVIFFPATGRGATNENFTACQVGGVCDVRSRFDSGMDETICRTAPDVCPRGARCTVVVTGRFFDADGAMPWKLRIGAAYAASPWVQAWGTEYAPDSICATGLAGDRCSVTVTRTAIGKGRPLVFGCVAYLDIYAGMPTLQGGFYSQTPKLGPDSVRRVECEAWVKVEPAGVLATTTAATTATVLAPGAGNLVVSTTVAPGPAPRAAAAAVRRRPAFATARVAVAEDGPVDVRLEPNRAARRLLARGKKLRVQISSVFTGSDGQVVERTAEGAVTSPPRARRTCRPVRQGRKLGVRCRRLGR